jgi:hypothetical protein
MNAVVTIASPDFIVAPPHTPAARQIRTFAH